MSRMLSDHRRLLDAALDAARIMFPITGASFRCLSAVA